MGGVHGAARRCAAAIVTAVLAVVCVAFGLVCASVLELFLGPLVTVALACVLLAAAGVLFCMEGASPTAVALLCASAALAAVYWYELDALELLDHGFSAVGAALGRMRAAFA